MTPEGAHMYARQVSMNLKPNKGDELIQTLENEILPLLRKQNGFEDEITLASREGKKAVAISLWDRKESADVYSRETYPQVEPGRRERRELPRRHRPTADRGPQEARHREKAISMRNKVVPAAPLIVA